jgi:DNA-binding NarL/FixJ family response regulator
MRFTLCTSASVSRVGNFHFRKECNTQMSSSSSAIRLLVVRSGLLVREALVYLLQCQPDFVVAAHVSCIEDAVRITSATNIDLAVIEFEPAHMEALCRGLSSMNRATKALVMGHVMQTQQLDALRPLVTGFLPDSANCAALIDAIRRVAAGQTWRDIPGLDGSAGLPHNMYNPKFSGRQQMVLHLVCEGLSNKECAQRLNVSPSSIKCTIQQLFEKTGTRSRSQLIRYAMEHLNHLLGRPMASQAAAR